MFKNAIVRKPSKSMVDGITQAGLGKPDYDLACEQHQGYVDVLKDLGLRVRVLDALEEYPDSCFVEDVALLTPECAVLTNPGAASRRGEVAAIADVVGEFYDTVEQIESPGFVEAGDIMMVNEHYYIGLSERTNQDGAYQMIEILERQGMSASVVPFHDVLHLKTGVNYLEGNKLLACGEFVDKEEFKQFEIIEVSPHDSYSANCIWVNDVVLVPQGFPATNKRITRAGLTTRQVAVSEFQKLDGGLSCLSLRF